MHCKVDFTQQKLFQKTSKEKVFKIPAKYEKQTALQVSKCRENNTSQIIQDTNF